MKLDVPFIKLPVCFDVERLQAEVRQFEEADWRSHPQKFAGNAALRLVTRDGDDNDDVVGNMLPTEHLWRCPYIRQVIRSFGVVVSRSRLMRLAPGSVVPQHSDTNFHWFNRVRIHIPIVTNDSVFFHCEDKTVNMREGEAWVFDNWRSHRVENSSNLFRIHLVIDTVGSSAFWQMCKQASRFNEEEFGKRVAKIPFRYQEDSIFHTETDNQPDILDPFTLKYLCQDFYSDLIPSNSQPQSERAIEHFKFLLTALCDDWSALYALYGNSIERKEAYEALLVRTRSGIRSIPVALVMKSNGVLAKDVFEARIAQGAFRTAPRHTKPVDYFDKKHLPQIRFERPLFIVSAPRSGSTLLFETLARNPAFTSLGDESHEIFEGIAGFNPAAGIVDDNRLTDKHYSAGIAEKIVQGFWRGLRNHDGSYAVPKKGVAVRLLEKTPKNSLRIPFLRALFPDALFVFLHRRPEPNIASMIDAWESGRWVTYPSLPRRTKPWSLLLPPGWREVENLSVPRIAAFQWCAANESIMQDLADSPDESILSVSYEAFLDHPQEIVQRILTFAGLPIDPAYIETLSEPLPLSKYTLSAPDQQKWRRHEKVLNEIRPYFEGTAQRIEHWRASLP